MIITVDGPAGAGKSTVSRRLAQELRLTYLNSGFIYRAVTLLVLESGGAFERRDLVEGIIERLDLRFVDEPERTRVFAGDREITDRLKAPDVTPQVFRIANDGGYRRLLVDSQRRFAAGPGVVAEGRDMGTVIFPDADFKFYLDASVEERARRALGDLRRAGHEKSLDQVRREVEERDRHDREREHAPLMIPEGSTVIDTDGMSAGEVVSTLVDMVRSARRSREAGISERTRVSREAEL
jgi:cytidylate kinase